ncbi:MAG: tetratricopeptide repeat protein [Nitrospinaceae bacterium]
MKPQSFFKKYLFEVIFSTVLVLLVSVNIIFPPSGPAEIQRAEVLSHKVLSLYKAGKYNDAVPIALRVLKIRERSLGPNHYDVAVALQTLAGIYQAVGDYGKAAPLDRRALKILGEKPKISRQVAAR